MAHPKTSSRRIHAEPKEKPLKDFGEVMERLREVEEEADVDSDLGISRMDMNGFQGLDISQKEAGRVLRRVIRKLE